MEEFKIEKGIPIPECANATKYPFIDMQVGDSFFVPLTEKINKEQIFNSVASTVCKLNKDHKINTSVARRVIDNGVNRIESSLCRDR